MIVFLAIDKIYV